MVLPKSLLESGSYIWLFTEKKFQIMYDGYIKLTVIVANL